MSREVPVAGVPFPVVQNETVTIQAPVAGGAQVNETSAATQPGGGAFAVVMA
jgi:hypothetical protein